MTIYVKQSGSWQPISNVYVKDSGSWSEADQVYVLGQSTQYLVHPTPSSSYAKTTSGTDTVTVPEANYTAVATVIGAGGGGGGASSNGDAWVGGGGGSGGFYTNQEFAVTPNETLDVSVGAGGIGASWRFNDNYSYNPRYSSYSTFGAGQTGGSSSLSRGGTALYTATGGTGGGQGATCVSGPGGSPNGVAGQAAACASNVGYGYTGPRNGGDTGLGYGDGADNPGLGYGRDGQDGAVLITFYTRTPTNSTKTLNINVQNRADQQAYGYGQFYWNGSTWMTRCVITDAGDGQGSGDSGWVTATLNSRTTGAQLSVGQAQYWFVIPDSTSNFNLPLLRATGTHNSSSWFSQRSFEFPGLLNTTNTSPNPGGYGTKFWYNYPT